jgi:rhamnogalacturonyl hydrolase YesR
MPNPQPNPRRTTVNIRKFKQWVFHCLSEDSLLYQVMQKEKDEITLEEALAKSAIIVALIESAVNSGTLKKEKGVLAMRTPVT